MGWCVKGIDDVLRSLAYILRAPGSQELFIMRPCPKPGNVTQNLAEVRTRNYSS